MALSRVDTIPRIKDAARLMKPLAHSERRMICCQASAAELSAGETETILKTPQPCPRRELSQLCGRDVLGTSRESKSTFYHLKDNPFPAIADTIYHVMLRERKVL